MTIERTGAQVRVKAENASAVPALGYADLVTRPAFWPELGQDPPVTATPRRVAVSIPPFGVQNLLFSFSDPESTAWAVVKLAANGHLLYGQVPAGTGAPEPAEAASSPDS